MNMYFVLGKFIGSFFAVSQSIALVSVSPYLKIGTTLAIFWLSEKTPSCIHSFITFDRRGVSKYFDNFKAHRISSYPHDFLEFNPWMSVSISSGVVGDKNIKFTWCGRKYVFIQYLY